MVYNFYVLNLTLEMREINPELVDVLRIFPMFNVLSLFETEMKSILMFRIYKVNFYLKCTMN